VVKRDRFYLDPAGDGMTCKINHDIPGTAPRELCRHCFPGLNATPYKKALDAAPTRVVDEKLQRKQARRERNRVRHTGG
jgi:hypothetical protein